MILCFSRYCPNSYCPEAPGVYYLSALCQLLIRAIHSVSELGPVRLPQLLSSGLFMTLFRCKICTIHSCSLPALGNALVYIRKHRYSCKEGCCGELGECICAAVQAQTP